MRDGGWCGGVSLLTSADGREDVIWQTVRPGEQEMRKGWDATGAFLWP